MPFGGNVFQLIEILSRNFVEGHQRNISAKSDIKSSKQFLARRFSKFPIYTYKAKCHAPWRGGGHVF
jgi:hypothetical protein